LNATDVLPLITGPVGALAVLIWVVYMQRRDLSEQRRTIEAERRRADVAEEAARTANALIASLLDKSRR